VADIVADQRASLLERPVFGKLGPEDRRRLAGVARLQSFARGETVFAEGETSARPGLMTCLRRVFWLPAKQWMTYRACRADLHQSIHALARASGWDSTLVLRRERLARKLVHRYLNSVARVAQYTAYERLFSLWHVAHIPFVYLLVVSAIVHVIAVHAY